MTDCSYELQNEAYVCTVCGDRRTRLVRRRCNNAPPVKAKATNGKPCGTCGQQKAAPPTEPGRPRRMRLPALTTQIGGVFKHVVKAIRDVVAGGQARTDKATRQRRREICKPCPLRDPETGRCTPCGCFTEAASMLVGKDCADPQGSRWANRIHNAAAILHRGGWLGSVETGPGIRVEPFGPGEVAVAVITAPRELPTLRDTVQGIRLSGFRQPLQIFAEPGTPTGLELEGLAGCTVHKNASKLGCFPNWLQAARWLLANTDAPWLLLCEDDCELAEAAGAALAGAIRTLEYPGCISLYSPRHNLGDSPRGIGWHPTGLGGKTWGALALAFPREVLARIVAEHANPPKDRTDQIIGAAVERYGLRFYSHYPSLGRHIGETSTIGHPAKAEHAAVGYAPDYDGYRFTDAPLRVAFLTPNVLCGGVERWFHGLVANTTGIDWRLWLSAPGSQSEEMVAALKPYATLTTGPGALPWILRTSDVLIAWGLKDLPGLIHGYSKPVVLVSHGGPEHRWTRDMLAASWPAATHGAAVSETAAASYGVRNRDIRVIPNGYQPERLFGGRDRATVRKSWGLPTDEIAIGYVGRLSDEKRPQAIARAVESLRQTDPGRKWRAVFVGPQYDPKMADRIKRHCPDALFVPPAEHVGEVYGALDVGMCASVSEGFCLSNLEMLAVGLPLVATRVGFIPGLEAKHGPLCVPIEPAATPEDLAAAVRLALSPSRRLLVEHARQVVQSMTAAESAKQWEAYLQEIARCQSAQAVSSPM